MAPPDIVKLNLKGGPKSGLASSSVIFLRFFYLKKILNFLDLRLF
jgi:hypothetical protein